MTDTPLSLVEIDDRIAIVRDNLRQLVEQAAARSGASDDDLATRRIAEQEAELAQLKQQREQLTRSRGRERSEFRRMDEMRRAVIHDEPRRIAHGRGAALC